MKVGDDNGFMEMVERQRDLIWHVCSDYSLSAAWTVEDAFQEVLVTLWRDWRRYEGRSLERTWVYRVATNVMLGLKRKMGNRPQPEEPLVDEAVEDDSNYQYLMQLIDTLPVVDATIVKAHLDGFSYAETAKVVNLSVTAVAMRLSRARHKLKERYEKGF